MTTYLITLTDGRIAEVTADDLTTRTDGSLWFLQAVEKPPAKLQPVLILARGQWREVVPKGTTAVLYESPPTAVAEAAHRGWDVEHFADEAASGKYTNANLREVLQLLASGQGDG